MSYLNNLHMVFSGRFQSDVSTVNNDVRHFDSEKFQPAWQEYQTKRNLNGWWNPCGSGAFRLIDCEVSRVGYTNGTSTIKTAEDPVVGMLIGGSNESTSAKMVDLDPQMQMVSEIWGLCMRLTNGSIPKLFEGQFLPAPFRDIIFGRQQGSSKGDQTATAIYQSVLEDLSWIEESSPIYQNSLFLQQLKAAASVTGKLSVRMMLYSYNTSHLSEEFTIGRVSGVIGPALPNEPDTFVLGRRFAPKNGTKTAAGINFFNAQADATQRSISVDLSNALPLSGGKGDFVDIGPLQLVVLEPPFDINSVNESDAITSRLGQYSRIGEEIPYLSADWMQQTGAVFEVSNIEAPLFERIQSQPLALINSASGLVQIRETAEGLLLRVDQVVHRINPDPTATVSVDFYASRYGHPAPGIEIDVSLQPPPEQGPMAAGKGPGILGIKIPVINAPSAALTLSPNATTNELGKASYRYSANDPNNPRGYIDGQLYFLNYQPKNSPNYIQMSLDIITNLVFDRVVPPAQPTWDDIQPIMAQYNNLYPIMGRMLVNLSSYAAIKKFRNILELAFSRPLSDPNYMPVTRDLSEPKRQMILTWLKEQDPDTGEYLLRLGQNPAEPSNDARNEPCASCEIELTTPDGLTVDSLSEDNLVEELSDIGAKEYAAKQYIKCKNQAMNNTK